VPLASPYIIGKALKWMLNSSSPFFIKPRLDKELVRWCMAFWHCSGKNYMLRNIPPLNEILQLSRSLMKDMCGDLGNHYRMQEKGCFLLYKTASSEKREWQFALEAEQLGIEARIYNAAEVQQLEPNLQVDVLGGVLYPIDCHLHPGDFMSTLMTRLIANGVRFQLNTKVTGFRTKDRRVLSVITKKGEFICDELILAAGSWLPQLCRMLGIDLLLQPGKGYSMTYYNPRPNLSHPAILVEHRVAMTPMGRDLRIGGTMELSGINHDILPHRVNAIYQATKAYFPGLTIEPPNLKDVWCGLRPLTPDGLPYIGRPKGYQNLTLAGGHAMLGLSLAAATGKLIEDMISGKPGKMDLSPFAPERFSWR
jgi:D-amino-acid dehydrogenase